MEILFKFNIKNLDPSLSTIEQDAEAEFKLIINYIKTPERANRLLFD